MIAKNGKKSLCLLLALGLVCTSVSNPSEAAKKAKLATKKMTLKVGQSKKISIKGKKKKAKYVFTSSAKKKATVSKAGVVKAKKVGKATITVKEKYKKKTKKLGKVKIVIQKKKGSSVNTAKATPTSNITMLPNPTAPASGTPTVTPDDSTQTTGTPTITPSPTPVCNSPTPTPTPVCNSPTPTPSEDAELSVPTGFRSQKAANAGTVENITYDSTVITEGKTIQRKAKVVLPKGYTTEKKYPVVYMQHGIFGDETSLYNDKTQYVIWNAIANGDAKEMIVVFPNACANEAGKGEGYNLEHYSAYNNFTNDLSECLMPYINAHYSTLTGRENTAICGFSMGGRVSLQIGFQKQEDFGYIGGFCPAYGIFKYTNYGVTEPGFFTEDTFTLKPEFMNNTLVLIAAGPKDTIVKTEPKRYADALAKNNVPHIYYETMGGDASSKGGGGHEAAVYQHGLYNFLKRIFKNTQGGDTPQPGPQPENASVDLSKADVVTSDGAGVKAEWNSTTSCLDMTLPQFQGAIIANTASDANAYKKITITYQADSAVNTYLFDSAMTDGIGQTPAGQHEVTSLPATDTFKTVTFEVGEDFSDSCITAIKLVHVDWNNATEKHVQIKSIVFSK